MRAVWASCAPAVLAAALLSGCVWRQPEIEEKEVPIGYRGEARVKPFLAAARFLEAMGLPVDDCFSLARLPDVQVAMLLPAEGDKSAPSAQRLVEWVSGGGHVIYLLRGGDSLLNDFIGELRWDDGQEEGGKGSSRPEEPAREEAPAQAGVAGDTKPEAARDGPSLQPGREPAKKPDGEGGKKEAGKPGRHSHPFLKALAVEVVTREKEVEALQISGKRWKVKIPAGQGFRVSREVAGTVAVHAAGPRGRRAFLSFPFGSGRVTLVADGRLWRNRYIGENDHAALLWEVARLVPGTAMVWIVRSTKVALFELIWQHGRRPLVGLALLFAVWLWWATRRFGPRLPDPEVGSREFAHHLEMSGGFLWRRKAVAALVEPARRRIRARFALHDGACREGSETFARLVRQSGLDEPAVKRALWGEVPREARSLTEQMKHLQILDSLT